MKTMRILLAVMAILVISSALFAAPKQDKSNNPNNPTTDGAIWGPNSVVPSTQHGNPQTVNQPNASAQGVYHQTLVDYLKSLGKGLGLIVEGAIWG